MLTPTQVSEFEERGFVFLPGLFDAETIHVIDERQRVIEPAWEANEWPEGCNSSAGRFFMMDEPMLKLVERLDIVAIAQQLLDCEDIHVGACEFGDSIEKAQAEGQSLRQIFWHADGDPDVPSVSFRTALDRHGPGNAPLRVLPGSHLRPRGDVRAEMEENECRVTSCADAPELLVATHPDEREIELDRRFSMVWTPCTWHATGLKLSSGRRRAMGWNYYPPQGRKRDLDALKHVLGENWNDWTPARKKLWGLVS